LTRERQKTEDMRLINAIMDDNLPYRDTLYQAYKDFNNGKRDVFSGEYDMAFDRVKSSMWSIAEEIKRGNVSEEAFLRGRWDTLIKLWDATAPYRERNPNMDTQEFEELYKHAVDFWKKNHPNEPRPQP
jgi:hypothetical protein